jgi:hypothetical protein
MSIFQFAGSIYSRYLIGLLADSKHTKRYKNLKEFIRRGESRALIEVKQKL